MMNVGSVKWPAALLGLLLVCVPTARAADSGQLAQTPQGAAARIDVPSADSDASNGAVANSPLVVAAPAESGRPRDDEAQHAGQRKGDVQFAGDPEGDAAQADQNFVANDASVGVLLNALSGALNKPVIVSAKAKYKKLTGEFDMAHPQALLRQLGGRMSLLWYDDGSSIYVYDNSEIRSAVISMQNATVRNLRAFIHGTRLYDARFPVRGDDIGNTFYVTGAPIYVNLVTAAAKYLDQLHGASEKDRQVIKIVRLQNSFVNDRRYALREKEINVPGMASVLTQVYGSGQSRRAGASNMSDTSGEDASTPAVHVRGTSDANFARPLSLDAPLPAAQATSPMASIQPAADITINAAGGVRAVAYPDTNSLILVGTLDKVLDMESVIHSLDVAKRQIELSLWIIDLKKSRLDQLGVNWQGRFGTGSFSVGFNQTDSSTNFTTLNGAAFLAAVSALSQKGDATVVSRPIVLTQDNVPALFDSNQTFYAKLIGERSVQLEHVTYGTLVSVLPRLSTDGSEVEMIVDVEDGNAGTDMTSSGSDSGTLPLVNRTEINTVARVPQEMSLLIGGNTRDDVSHSESHVPGLASIPLVGGLFRSRKDTHEQLVRVFLIQPKLLKPRANWQDGQTWEAGDSAGNETLRATVDLVRPYLDNHR